MRATQGMLDASSSEPLEEHPMQKFAKVILLVALANGKGRE
jgi:hypothetical protein